MGLLYRHVSPWIEILDCTDPFEFSPHIHDRYVIWLNTGCGERFSVQRKRRVLQAGSIGVLEPGLVHANSPCSAGLRHLRSFYIDPVFFHDLAGRSGLKRREVAFGDHQIGDPEIWTRLARLHDRMTTGHPDLETDTGILETFLCLLNRHAGYGVARAKISGDGRIERVVDYFHANIGAKIRLKEIAGLAGCSEFHLIRLFRDRTGLSPHAFLIQLRLEKARQLIQNGASIASASQDCGFSDQSHLSRDFKLRYGVTPRAYARQCQFSSRPERRDRLPSL